MNTKQRFSCLLALQSLSAQNGNFVDTKGVKICYETHGEGEPLLLLHGFSLSHKAWDNWIEDLSKEYLWIVPNDSHIPIGIYGRNSIWSDVFLKVLMEFTSGSWK